MEANTDMIAEQELMKKLLSVLFPKAKIYLFGSRGQGIHRPESDFDIAIDDQREIPLEELWQARRVMEAIVPHKIDMVDFNFVPQELKENIISGSIIWQEKKE